LYPSPNIIRVIESRRMRCAKHTACMGDMRNAYRILAGKSEWKTSLWRPRHRWENNIKMDLKKNGMLQRALYSVGSR
jgi:hypothetical protein